MVGRGERDLAQVGSTTVGLPDVDPKSKCSRVVVLGAVRHLKDGRAMKISGRWSRWDSNLCIHPRIQTVCKCPGASFGELPWISTGEQ
jgi:hypothetical protein